MLLVMSAQMSNQRKVPIGLAVGAMLCMTLGGAPAQTSTPQLAGIVRDSSGAAIRGAKLTLTDDTNSPVQSATTDGEGKYAFSSIKPGRYILLAEAPAFGGSSWHLTVRENEHLAHIDFILEPGRDSDNRPPIGYYEQSRMKPSEMNMAIDAGGHSSPGPARTNVLVQGVSALKNETASPGKSSSPEHTVTSDASEDNLFDQGNRLLLDQRLDPAIEVFERGTQRYPHSTKLAIGLGVALYARGRYDKAIKALCAASDLSPSDPRPYLFLARIDEGLTAGSDEVTKRLERYFRLQPQSALAHYYYAMDLWRSRRNSLEQIESLLKSAISLDPTLAGAHLALANAYAEDHNYAGAIPEYQQAIKLQPDLTDVHYRLAQAYSRGGQEKLAQQELELHERVRKEHVAEFDRYRAEVEQFVEEVKTAPKP